MENVCIIGCGRQGTAAAYDILLYQKPKNLLLLDISKDSLKLCNSKIKRVISDSTLVSSEIIDFQNTDNQEH